MKRLSINLTQVLFIALITLSLVRCDFLSGGSSGGIDEKTTPFAEGPTMPINIDKEGSYSSLKEVREEARALIESRKKESPYPFTLLTDSYWTWSGFFDGQFMWDEKNFTKHWIKFEDNFTYTYGYGADVTGMGSYHFRMKDNIIIMLDNDEKYQPKQLIFSDGGSSIMFGGLPAFKLNNGMQMKLDPHPQKPF